ncbi:MULTISPECIES: carboxymuconolactone decarboxylase family protein [Alphaproteobacteria]|uniref:Carboxymuconolactone decarboxylase family protein n=1 Tax=Methylobacterium currus TaxID=2051553 RepID=A0A2R4WW69_9HYPH|nr:MULTISPECIES: carboxymuconolactone decarboxylase family protein [Alphaproteobacteria]AWB25765.1 hypothetical protein DA075_33590 [Methylobacterium currus]MBX3478206.1 carboxymuconolactone decarboxylase family protein [Brevundimonas sp.]NGM32811.1 carboxymuconolactone decarboxylase family protein [Methylobacterium sp. DB0501]
MRLPPIPPNDLSPEVRALHDAIVERMGRSLSAFASQDADGALIGPFPALLHFPRFGAPAFAFLDSLVGGATLPETVREVVILAVGARFKARYELYSHEKMAVEAGLPRPLIAAIAAGQRPPDLDEMQAAAFDFVTAATGGGSVPASTYEQARALFGNEGVGELAFLVASYTVICILLNAFDVPVPEN